MKQGVFEKWVLPPVETDTAILSAVGIKIHTANGFTICNNTRLENKNVYTLFHFLNLLSLMLDEEGMDHILVMQNWDEIRFLVKAWHSCARNLDQVKETDRSNFLTLASKLKLFGVLNNYRIGEFGDMLLDSPGVTVARNIKARVS